MPLVAFVTALAIGLISTHCLVIPTPGPLAVMANMNLQAGPFIGAGLLVALVAALVGGLVMGRWVSRNVSPEREAGGRVRGGASGRRHAAAVRPRCRWPCCLFPILLILLGSVSAPLLAQDSWARQLLTFAGDKNVALFAGVILASVTMRPFLAKSLDALVVEGAASAGLILLITGAGGFFGSVISASGIGDYLVSTLSSLHLSLVLLGFCSRRFCAPPKARPRLRW
jgi:GntP family gluconate:H+ symporter